MARRARIAVGIAVAVVVLGGLGLAALLVRDSTSPVSALDLDVPEPGSSLGDQGLYRYATTGYETIDALGGARHDYPDQTFVVVTFEGCGDAVRWHALIQRWQRWDWCDATLGAVTSFHRWFGSDDEERWACTGGMPLTVASPGDSWTERCESDRSVNSTSVEVIGFADVPVGAGVVPTLHVVTSSTLTGGTVGTESAEIWYLRDSPLIVVMEATADTVTDSRIGAVSYRERVRIELVSTAPGE